MEDNLYIIKASNEESQKLIKFGYSSKLKERLNQYFSHNPLTEVLFTFYREDALEFEQFFHKNNKSIYKNEWYTYDKLDEIIHQIENSIYVEPKIKSGNKRKKRKPKYYVIVLEKVCYNCKQLKSSECFHKNCWKINGISDLCKICSNIKSKEYREIKKENL